MTNALNILAGPAALEIIRERGLRPEDVDIMAGASGGPKWLVLSGLDRVLFPWLGKISRGRPVHLIGSSIGSWRMACLAMRDSLAAVTTLEEVYIQQRYSPQPPPAEVSSVGARMLDDVLGAHAEREILENPGMRLHVITALCHGLLGSEHKPVLAAGLAMAALANFVSRKSLGRQMQRVIFDNAGNENPFLNLNDLPTQRIALNSENLRTSLMASGSIPLVLEGVRVPGAPSGIYRDGGVIDYHPDLNFGHGDGLVLYPHFYPYIVPGWFDKSLPWRKASGSNLDRVVLLSPSAEFIDSLPGRRIPDRKDFYRYDTVERIRIWRQVCEMSKRLGDEFAELLTSGKWAARVRPLSTKGRAI